MSYLLDTNILSETLRPKPNPNVINWLKQIQSDSLCMSVLSLGEIRKGIEKLDTGKRKSQLILWLETELPKWFGPRILPITAEIAERWGFITAVRKDPLPVIDGLLAATALVHDLKIVTRNLKDFRLSGIEIIDPFNE